MKKYDEVIEQRRKVIEEMKPLQESEIVRRYLELKEQNDTLLKKQTNLYKEMKNEKYSSCEHVLIYSKMKYDEYEGRTHKYCGCIKCGLDESILETRGECLSFQEEIMYDYLMDNKFRGKYLNGEETKIACDINLAQAIYSRIKQTHPDIDDKTATKYFKVALNNIRSNKVNEERKSNRARRLSLDPKFKNWNRLED